MYMTDVVFYDLQMDIFIASTDEELLKLDSLHLSFISPACHFTQNDEFGEINALLGYFRETGSTVKGRNAIIHQWT